MHYRALSRMQGRLFRTFNDIGGIVREPILKLGVGIARPCLGYCENPARPCQEYREGPAKTSHGSK